MGKTLFAALTMLLLILLGAMLVLAAIGASLQAADRERWAEAANGLPMRGRLMLKREAHEFRVFGLRQVSIAVPMIGVGVLVAFWFRRRWAATANRDKRSVLVWLGAVLIAAACFLSWFREALEEHSWPEMYRPVIAIVVLVAAGLFSLRAAKTEKSSDGQA